jgi:uncharacterized protein YxjI
MILLCKISMMKEILKQAKVLHVQQVLEGFEVVLGWESRNKYRILDERQSPVAYAAEVKTGILGALMRGFLGHWRTFNVTIYNQNRTDEYFLNFPFRWFFKTLFVKEAKGSDIGYLQQRFAIFRKKFDIYDRHHKKIGFINSSFFRFWTFDIYNPHAVKMASIKKKWSGVLSEMFTDRDNFVVEYYDQGLSEEVRALILSTCIMVDIVYFERKQQ